MIYIVAEDYIDLVVNRMIQEILSQFRYNILSKHADDS